jgi:hydrophobic/amphiphilic exporter-1 (mainly G- bacteria), HAE1 family
VGEVTVFGAGDYSMRIWLDPGKLKARNLTASDVMAALGEQNVQVAAGQIGAPPTPPGTAFQYTIEAGPTAGTRAIRENHRQSGRRGAFDVFAGRCPSRVGSQVVCLRREFNGTTCAAVAIYQLPGANAMEVAARVRATMEELSRDFPSGLEYRIPFDTTRFVPRRFAKST